MNGSGRSRGPPASWMPSARRCGHTRTSWCFATAPRRTIHSLKKASLTKPLARPAMMPTRAGNSALPSPRTALARAHAPPYHPQFEKGKPYKTARKARYDANTGRHLRAAISENPGFRCPRSVLHVASESNTVHHTQKPLALFEYLIKTYTNPGEL